MESILCVDIPVQMISCTDTNGKITPLRFRFKDNNGELVTVTVKDVISDEQAPSRVGQTLPAQPSLAGLRRNSCSGTTTLPMNGDCHSCVSKNILFLNNKKHSA